MSARNFNFKLEVCKLLAKLTPGKFPKELTDHKETREMEMGLIRLSSFSRYQRLVIEALVFRLCRHNVGIYISSKKSRQLDMLITSCVIYYLTMIGTQGNSLVGSNFHISRSKVQKAHLPQEVKSVQTLA